MKFSTRGVVILLFALVSCQNYLNAQSKVHDHEHEHEHAANEFGLGNFLSILVGEQEYAYGLHIHYLRTIKDSRFGFGIGYEQIYDEHKHRTLGLIGTYRLSQPLILSLLQAFYCQPGRITTSDLLCTLRWYMSLKLIVFIWGLPWNLPLHL